MVKRLIALAIVVALTACGGGSGGGGAAASSSSLGGVTPPTAQSAMVAGDLLVIIGSNTQSNDHRAAPQSVGRVHPDFIASSTLSAVWTATSTTGGANFTGIADLSSTSSLCTSSGSGRTCTIPFTVSAGSYTFTLKTYDQAPVGGVIPSTAKQLAIASLTATILPSTNNSLVFVLSGIVAGITTTNGLGAATYFSTPANGAVHTVAIGVVVTDPDGNTITGTAPYASAIPVTLAETGGSGHEVIYKNGVSVGTSTSITSPQDTIAIHYDGGGAPGYTGSLSIGSTSPVVDTISPMYVVPGSIAIGRLSDSHTLAVTEASAPSSIAYATTIASCPTTTSEATTGGGATSSVVVTSNVPGGTSASCTATVQDILGTALVVPITFTVPGPFGGLATTTGTGVTGSCATTVSFSGVGQIATTTLTDPGYSGTVTASSSNTGVVTVSVSGFTVTITSVAAGTATISGSDSVGNTFSCPTGVTTTGGSVT